LLKLRVRRAPTSSPERAASQPSNSSSKRTAAPPLNSGVRTHMDPLEIAEQKDIEHYSASVNAWFNTALEHDKSILTLSAAGIGLLVTLLTTTGLASAEALVLYIMAILSFMLAIGCVLCVFERNKVHIEQVISGVSKSADAALSMLDRCALFAFGAGVIFSVVIGISAGVNSYSKGRATMADQPKVPENLTASNESFNMLANLKPQSDVGKSFNNLANLKPSLPTEPASTTPVQQPSGTTTSTQTPTSSSSSGD